MARRVSSRESLSKFAARCLVGGVIALGVVVATVPFASAVPFVPSTSVNQNQADAFLNGVGDNHLGAQGQNVGVDSLTAIVPGSGSNLVTAGTSGSVAFGALKGFSSASLNVENDFDHAQAQTFFRITFNDQFTLSGPIGQLGDFVVTLTLESSVTCTNTASFSGSNLTEANVFIDQNPFGSNTISKNAGLQGNCANGGGFQSTAISVTALAGTVFDLAGALGIRTGVSRNPGSGDFFPNNQFSQSVVIDAQNTGEIFVDVLTQGFSIAAASGANYATGAVEPPAIAEPASLALVGFGLAGIGWSRRGRHTR